MQPIDHVFPTITTCRSGSATDTEVDFAASQMQILGYLTSGLTGAYH
jgi:hypothetical protein